jgi:23S rRNA pseudouridine2605 synthase
MRKSSFGHRPPRGKPQDGGSRHRDRSSTSASGGRGGREERRDGQGGKKKPFAANFRARTGEQGEKRGSEWERPDRREKPSPATSFRVRKPGPRPGGGKKGAPQQRVPSVSEPMRIAKAMARAGLCSRREAERWIADGRVSLNGQVLKTPAVEVRPKDRVLVDGQPLPLAEPSQLWRYNKPKGVVTTHNDPQGRPTVFDNLPPGLPRVISVGRLDFNTEGLILLTNDGELARHLELPATGWLRRYRVRAKGRVTQVDLDKLKEGVEIDGVRYGPVEATLDTMQGANMWLTVGIREGKNREVRKVLSSLGLDVNRLIRVSFGPFQLLDLKPGDAEVVRRRVLADQLGPQLAAEFGLVEASEDKPAKKKGPQRPHPKSKGEREDA